MHLNPTLNAQMHLKTPWCIYNIWQMLLHNSKLFLAFYLRYLLFSYLKKKKKKNNIPVHETKHN